MIITAIVWIRHKYAASPASHRSSYFTHTHQPIKTRGAHVCGVSGAHQESRRSAQTRAARLRLPTHLRPLIKPRTPLLVATCPSAPQPDPLARALCHPSSHIMSSLRARSSCPRSVLGRHICSDGACTSSPRVEDVRPCGVSFKYVRSDPSLFGAVAAGRTRGRRAHVCQLALTLWLDGRGQRVDGIQGRGYLYRGVRACGMDLTRSCVWEPFGQGGCLISHA